MICIKKNSLFPGVWPVLFIHCDNVLQDTLAQGLRFACRSRFASFSRSLFLSKT